MAKDEHQTELEIRRSAEFMDLITPNQSRLFGYIFALVKNADDAHDLYQQTVLALWRKFDTYQPGTKFTAWAMRTAQLECLTFQRTHRRSRLQFNETLVAQLTVTQAEHDANDIGESRQKALDKCLKELDEKDHSLVQECYRQGVQIQQVAAKRERSPQSVCNSLRRIRMSLMKCIDTKLAQAGEA